MMDWKQEAQKQAAAAGELRIALAEHLIKLRVLIQNSKRRVQREEDADVQEREFHCTRAIVLQCEHDWLEEVLAGGYRIGGDANGNQ